MHRSLGIVAATCVALAASMAAAAADCTCRAGGRNYELGQTACLATPEGLRIATCGMVLNNTSWRVSPDACIAALKSVQPAAARAAQEGRKPQGG